MITKQMIKSAFESMLYTFGQPLSAKDAAEVFDISEEQAVEYFEELMEEYEREKRGIRIRRMNKYFQFVTAEENADYIRKLLTPVKVKKLSQAALEVLAIIAYRQPVTKGEIDQIRGVKCDRVVEGLLRKNLIESKGQANTIGRPTLYGTTLDFLKNFGFESLNELPEIDDIGTVIEQRETEEDPMQISMDIGV